LDDAEIAAVMRAASGVGYPFGTIVQILMLTGQRRNEVAGMKWSHVDLTDRVWRLPPAVTKNHRAHTLPMPAAVCERLARVARTGDDRVFPSLRHGERAFSGFSRSKARLDASAQVNGWTLHDLRRTAATHMARLGVAPHVVERILNHVSGSLGGVAGIYNRFQYLPEMRAALELWSTHVAAILDPDIPEKL
jgi:integrase